MLGQAWHYLGGGGGRNSNPSTWEEWEIEAMLTWAKVIYILKKILPLNVVKWRKVVSEEKKVDGG